LKLAKLLSIVAGNLRNLLLVLVNLPFAFVGGGLAALLTGGNLSLGSLVGFVTLFGVTLRNSIMLISHYEHFGARGRLDLEPGDCDSRRFGAIGADLDDGVGHRLGLLPLAIGSGDPGREIERPLATVVLGGLVTSTALKLLVPPRM